MEALDKFLNLTMHPLVFWGIPFIFAGIIEIRRKFAAEPKKEK